MKARFTRFDKALKAATETSIAASQAEIERRLAEALKPPEQPEGCGVCNETRRAALEQAKTACASPACHVEKRCLFGCGSYADAGRAALEQGQ